MSQQGSVGSWNTVIIVGFIGGVILYTISPSDVQRFKEEQIQIEEIQLKTENKSTANRHKMTGEALPGRPGTLTAAEEEKLREFWVATLKVFGALDGQEADEADEVNGNGHVEPGIARTGTDKPKKKRFGILRKKNKEDTASAASSTHTTVEDDKYGQTKEFHEALASLSPETLRATFWSMVKHDHPDALLLRFLRARKWDVEKALVMMVSTMRWRASDMKVDDDIMWNGEMKAVEEAEGTDPAKKKSAHDFLAQMRLGKSFLHGLDKAGRPMCFVRVRLHKQGEQSEQSLERYTVFVIESARMILAPPVDTACVVFDMTGFSMANMDYAPVKFMIKCFEANYPESLGVVLVHKAPWIFQGIWKIIKGWLDPVVASKVHFTNNNQEMEEFVPASHIIKELNGAEDWTYNYIEPVPGENDLMKDVETRDKLLAERKEIVREYEDATLEWIHDGGKNEAIKTKRNELANKLRDDYWKLDPYIRARSYYDRVGLINPGGRLQFYPGETIDPTPTVPTNETKPAETSADDVE